MSRNLFGGLLSAFVLLGFASGTSAQAATKAPVVERSGLVYHTSVCAFAVGMYARCHAHVVTDSKGTPLGHANPDIGGKTPANLRDA